jgi:hypothetical protein
MSNTNNTNGDLVGSGIKEHTGHALLTCDQVTRALALQIALTLLVGRNVQVHQIMGIAKWIYDGKEH